MPRGISQLSLDRIGRIVCAALLIAFAVLAYSAARTKSATYDEPMHLVGSYLHRFHDDYRINPEDPALFGWWASLPMTLASLRPDLESDTFQQAATDIRKQWPFSVTTLYRSDGADAHAVLMRSRGGFVVAGALLLALTAWWAWRLAGPVAGMIAAGLIALDPNFLGHTALIKNDVLMTLMLLLLGVSLWQFGRRGSWYWLLALGATCGAAANTKFSGVLAGPITVAALFAAALLHRPWRVIGLSLRSLWARLAMAMACCAVVALIGWGVTWSLYGFRFAAMPSGQLLDSPRMVSLSKQKQAIAEGGGAWVSEEQAQDRAPALPVRLATWLEDRRLLPQAWTYGFLYTYTTCLVRSSYLLGQTSLVGFLGYFPLAMLFKTPTATLVLVGVVVVGLLRRETRSALTARSTPRGRLWLMVCLLLPPLTYFASAVLGNLNLGLRHVLPVYPYLYIVIAMVLGHLLATWRRPGRIAVAGLGIALLAETLVAWPNYVAFFNAPSGGSRGGFYLLSDSNLDWGQDLPALAKWRDAHRDRPLYLAYFGSADPDYYRLDAIHLPGGYYLAKDRFQALSLDRPVYVAVSATTLQGTYLNEPEIRLYQALRERKPMDVLNGTIYLYGLSPR